MRNEIVCACVAAVGVFASVGRADEAVRLATGYPSQALVEGRHSAGDCERTDGSGSWNVCAWPLTIEHRTRITRVRAAGGYGWGAIDPDDWDLRFRVFSSLEAFTETPREGDVIRDAAFHLTADPVEVWGFDAQSTRILLVQAAPLPGQELILEPGTYFISTPVRNYLGWLWTESSINMGTAYWVGTGSNFQVRPLTAWLFTTGTLAIDIFGEPAPVCGTADFDGDGDSGTDADIEAFFACLSGNCCASCFVLGTDFDGDGDSGTDGDIESFFRVLAGGSC